MIHGPSKLVNSEVKIEIVVYSAEISIFFFFGLLNMAGVFDTDKALFEM